MPTEGSDSKPKQAAEQLPEDPATDSDSAGVYFISVEDFEARRPPKESPAKKARPRD